MHLWQKLVLVVLFLTAVAALGGAGILIYAERVNVPTEPPVTGVARVDQSPTVEPVTGVARVDPSPTVEPVLAVTVVRGVLTSPTPFQPLPITPTPSPSPVPTVTPIPTLAPVEPTLPPVGTDEVYINGIWGFQQYYNLSCESRSASDLARYFGVYFTELEFLYALPSSDNPDAGFVGDVQGALGQLPPLGYGVHARPVAELMQSFGLNAAAHKGLTLTEVKEELAAGRPVMIWAIKDLGISTPVEYTASDGDTTIVARFEHTYIVIGYGPGYITVLDNERIYSVSTEQFLDSWRILGNMGITVAP